MSTVDRLDSVLQHEMAALSALLCDGSSRPRPATSNAARKVPGWVKAMTAREASARAQPRTSVSKSCTGCEVNQRGLGSESTRVQGGGYVVASLARGALSQERAPIGQTCKNPARCFRIPSQSRPALQMTSLALSMQDWNNLALQVSV